MNRTLLVTGGAGFIGANFVHYWMARYPEDKVIVLDALTYAGNLASLDSVSRLNNFCFVHESILNQKRVEALLREAGVNTIVHFAAESHVDRSIDGPGEFIVTNVVGTYTLLEASRTYMAGLNAERKSRFRFHHVSTDEVYGDLGDNSTDYFTEMTPLAPNCPYAAAKTSADLLVNSWHETYGMHTVITRCSNNYGPYQFPEKLIPFMLFRAMRNEDLTLYGDGKNIRDWLYVLDHCEAILTAFEKSPPGEVWNIGGHNEKTNIEIAELILKNVPESTSGITFVSDRKAHDRRYAIDASKIERKLAWRPAHTFEEALPKTIQWYLSNREWVESCMK